MDGWMDGRTDGRTDRRTDRQTDRIYYEKLVHAIMEAEISHNLLSADWRSRKAGGIIQPESDRLRIRVANDISSRPRAGEDEMRFLSLSNEATNKEEQIPPPSTVCSIQAANKLEDAHLHWGGQSTLMSPLIQMLISSGKTLTNTKRKNHLIWAPHGQSSGHKSNRHMGSGLKVVV